MVLLCSGRFFHAYIDPFYNYKKLTFHSSNKLLEWFIFWSTSDAFFRPSTILSSLYFRKEEKFWLCISKLYSRNIHSLACFLSVSPAPFALSGTGMLDSRVTLDDDIRDLFSLFEGSSFQILTSHTWFLQKFSSDGKQTNLNYQYES